jgi:hypothetical protein
MISLFVHRYQLVTDCPFHEFGHAMDGEFLHNVFAMNIHRLRTRSQALRDPLTTESLTQQACDLQLFRCSWGFG